MDKLRDLLSDMVACESFRKRGDIANEIEKLVNNLNKPNDSTGKSLELVYAPIEGNADQQFMDGLRALIRPLILSMIDEEMHNLAVSD